MAKIRLNGRKNISGARIKELRESAGLSQRDLAHQLQLAGIDLDKNVITRIETGKRYVNDFELYHLVKLLNTSYQFLIEGPAPEQAGILPGKNIRK